MEDFREIVGFLIIGIGILLSVLKERKGKDSSGSSTPAQKTPIQRRPQNQQPRSQRPAPQQSASRPQASSGTSSLPFVMSSLAERARQLQAQQSLRDKTEFVGQPGEVREMQPTSYEELPEEGARVTQDIPPMDSISDIADEDEQELIEKLREGIILSEILKRKF